MKKRGTKMKKMIIGMLLTGVLLSAKDMKNYKIYRNKITRNKTMKTKKIIKNKGKNMENVKSGDAELIEGLSTEVRPQDDFYKYVNEKWLEKTKIPGTKSSWSNFVVLSEQNQEFVKNLIKELKKARATEIIESFMKSMKDLGFSNEEILSLFKEKILGGKSDGTTV